MTAGLFLFDFVVLDPIPFVDELLLGLGTLLLASWRRPVPPPAAPPSGQTIEGESRRE